jgi:preprotein translocase subunit SecG
MTRSGAIALVVVVLVPRAASACPICFGAADSALLHGARSGVLAMAAITVIVLAAFARWFVKLRRLQEEGESS